MTLPQHIADQLADAAQRLARPHKGVLAADESPNTMGKRLQSINADNSPDMRLAWRRVLLQADKPLQSYISGVILHPETFLQSDGNGVPFPKRLEQLDVAPGIKVDLGVKPLALGNEGETVTIGSDGLRERIIDAKNRGAVFAKWRAVHPVSINSPSRTAAVANAHALASYAAVCQENGVVPVVEPEVLADGNHSIDQHDLASSFVLQNLFRAMRQRNVMLEGIILKPSMILPGFHNQNPASDEEIAQRTLTRFARDVPAAVPAILFLSGGQSPSLATSRLNALNSAAAHHSPWALAFSYGRALQSDALAAWNADPANIPAAQNAFSHRARMCALAVAAAWTPNAENLTDAP